MSGSRKVSNKEISSNEMAKKKIRSVGIQKRKRARKAKSNKHKDEFSLSLKFILPFGLKIRIRGLEKIIQKVSRLASSIKPIILRQRTEVPPTKSNDKNPSIHLKTALHDMAKEALNKIN